LVAIFLKTHYVSSRDLSYIIDGVKEMKKANLAVLLYVNRSRWLLLPSFFGISSAVYAADSSATQDSHYADHVAPGFTSSVSEVFNTVPLNAFAWLSLSAMMVLLFFSKRQASTQPATILAGESQSAG
jgi:hypothetical protein